MRILLMSAAGLAALNVAPATAQSYSPDYSAGYASNYSRVAVPRPWQIRSMIDAAERRGDITDDQATNLREEADELSRLDRRAERDDDSDARRDVRRRTFALLRDLREAGGDSGSGYAYRDRSSAYPPAYPTPPQGNYDYNRSAPGSDDDQPYAPRTGNDSYRNAPPAYDPNRAAPENYDTNRAAPEDYDRYRAAPSANNPYRAAPPADDPYRAGPPSSDEQNYDDPNGQDDTPPDDGIYRPRN